MCRRQVADVTTARLPAVDTALDGVWSALAVAAAIGLDLLAAPGRLPSLVLLLAPEGCRSGEVVRRER